MIIIVSVMHIQFTYNQSQSLSITLFFFWKFNAISSHCIRSVRSTTYIYESDHEIEDADMMDQCSAVN